MNIEYTSGSVIIRKCDVTYKCHTCSAPFYDDLMGSYFNGEMIYNSTGMVKPIAVIRFHSCASTSKIVPKLELYYKTFFDTYKNNLSMFIKVIDVIKEGNESLRFLITEPFEGIRLSCIINEEWSDFSESFVAIQLHRKQNQNREMFAIKIMEGVIRIVETLRRNRLLLNHIDPDYFYVSDNFETKLFYCYSPLFDNKQDQFCGNCHGTYSSPEVILGDVNKVNESSGTYSLGLLLYHLSTGEEPFPGNAIDAFDKQMTGKIQVEKIKDKRLRSIVEKSTSKKQDNRYNNIASMYEALERLYKQDCCNTQNTKGYSLKNILYSPISMVTNLAYSLFFDSRSNKRGR